MQQPAATVLGNYIARETLVDLPPDVVEAANDCLLDSLGCLLGGYALPIASILDEFLDDLASSGDVQIIGSNRRTDPGTAAFVHACLINSLDFDDIYRKGHPGATVVSAALSAAARTDSSGTDLLEAMVVGYEVSGRIAMSLKHLHPRKTLHGHGTWQVLGAAAAVAKLLKLNGRQSANALAIAASNAPVASVMKTVYGAAPVMAKNNFGTAAQTGLNAAFLARNGFEGPLGIFEGNTGFWRMAGADACEFEYLTAGLGHIYEIREVGFKSFSCCRILQSSIQASVKVFTKAGINPRDRTYERLVVTPPQIVCESPFNNPAPADIWAAQFSAPYTIAMALLDIKAGPDWFLETQMRNDVVASLIMKIKLLPNTDKTISGSHHISRARLYLKDGQIFDSEVKIALGEAANPLPRSFLKEKFVKLAKRRLGTEPALGLLRSIVDIANVSSIRSLLVETVPSNPHPADSDQTVSEKTCPCEFLCSGGCSVCAPSPKETL